VYQAASAHSLSYKLQHPTKLSNQDTVVCTCMYVRMYVCTYVHVHTVTHIPRVGIIEDDLIDSIVSGGVGPHGWTGIGVDSKERQDGRNFLLRRLHVHVQERITGDNILYCTVQTIIIMF
jgi:hypothetical protein